MLFKISIKYQEVSVTLERQFMLVDLKENCAVNMDVIQSITMAIIANKIRKGS